MVFSLSPVSVYGCDRQRNLGLADMTKWASNLVVEEHSFFLRCLLREVSDNKYKMGVTKRIQINSAVCVCKNVALYNEIPLFSRTTRY